MRRQFIPLAAAAFAVGTAASADPFVDAVVRNFQNMGYQFVEIERGQTQLKAEGVRGNEELEVIYDLSTGQIIKQERGRADAEYIGRTGVEIDVSNRDFVGGDSSGGDDDDDDDDDDDRSGSRDDDDDDDDDDRSGSRDDDDDNSGSGSGRDDDDDDHGGSDDSSDGSDDDSESSGGSDDSSGGSDDNDDDD
jgi:hypothetical protein